MNDRFIILTETFRRTVAPSLIGRVMRVEQDESLDLLVIAARQEDVIQVDASRLERDSTGNYIVPSTLDTWRKHGLPLLMDLPVAAWVQPRWTHVLIGDGPVVLWRAISGGFKE